MVITNSEKKILNQTYENILQINKFSDLSNTELMMAVLGYKPAMAESRTLDAKIHQNLNKIRRLGQQIGLHMATSQNKYIVNSPRGIFDEIPLDDPRLGKIIIAFSDTKAKAKNGADYYHKKMLDSYYSDKFARLMGYPECCLEFGRYLNNHERDSDNFGFKNPAVESLKRSKHFAWQLNVFTYTPLSHYPCSLTCKKSVEYVNKVMSCYEYIDKRCYSFLSDYAKQPASLYWTCVDKILLYGAFKQYDLGTGEIKYHKIEPMIASNTFYQEVDKNQISEWKNIEKALRKGNKLIVTDNTCCIYFDKKKTLEIKKTNKYIPVLVKPDLLS